MSVLLLWMGVHCTYAGQLQSSVIIIIRHAEKPDAGDGLAPAGDARANAYVDYFKHFTVNSNTIHFDYLFAAKDSHESKRPKLTIKPLSKALGLDINTDFKDAEYAKLGDELSRRTLQQQEYPGVLASWEDSEIARRFWRGSSEITS